MVVVVVEEAVFLFLNLSRAWRIDLGPEGAAGASEVEAGASSGWVRGLKEGRLFRIELNRDLGDSEVEAGVEVSASEPEVGSGLSESGQEEQFRNFDLGQLPSSKEVFLNWANKRVIKKKKSLRKKS